MKTQASVYPPHFRSKLMHWSLMSLPRMLFGVLALLVVSAQAEDGEWEELSGCQVVESPQNDGDSVKIVCGDREQMMRLFFVDTIEMSPDSRIRRVKQARYFGIPEAGREEAALLAASAASRLTAAQLAEPFTVFTRWERVDPNGKNPAVRAFVRTADGQDLGEMLVREGLAIIREGKASSAHPDGRNISEQVSALRAAETRARLEGKGAWGLAGPTKGKFAPVSGKSDFQAEDQDGLFASAGQPVTVHGKVSQVATLPDGRITFVNFEGAKTGGFVGIIRGDFLPLFHEKFSDDLESSLVGRELTLEGVITLYRDIPQIELQRPEQITVEKISVEN